MPPKNSGNWENPQFLMDLAMAFYEVGTRNGGLGPPTRDGISQYLAGRGHTVSWEAIRQHIQKLRKTRDTSAIQDGASPSAAKTSAAKKPAATRKRATPKKGAKAVQEFKEMYDEDDEQFPFVKNEIYEDDDDIEARSPTLKTKRVKKEHLSAGDDADYGV